MTVVDPFLLLGVAPNATEEEIDDAYRRLAQIYHPDRYATAPEDVRSEASQRMTDLNAARASIRSGYRPTKKSQQEEDPLQKAYEAAVAYAGPYCVVCGSAPVLNVKFKVGVGKVIWRGLKTWEGPTCAGCGEAIYRDLQNETMLKGWWGLISFFANLTYIFTNWQEHGRLVGIARPQPTPKSLLTPLPHPLPEGPSLFQRAGIWVSAVVLAIVALYGWGSLEQASVGGSTGTEADRLACASMTEESNADIAMTVERAFAADDPNLVGAAEAAVEAAQADDESAFGEAWDSMWEACVTIFPGDYQ